VSCGAFEPATVHGSLLVINGPRVAPELGPFTPPRYQNASMGCMMHSMSPDIVRGLCLEWVIMDFWTTALSQDVAADLNRRIAELERQLKATAAENARLL
jgi:hypothetical protein